MAGFKVPDFAERAALSRDAKAKALETLRNKPPVDEAVVAERLAAQERKDAAAAEKRRLKAEAEAAAKAEKEARAAAAAAEAAAKAEAEEAERIARAPKAAMTDEMRKALRDARYAARKARK